MIHYYTGVPGSGKSLHCASVIYKALRNGKNVISNFEVDTSLIKPLKGKPVGQFIYMSSDEILDNHYYTRERNCKRKPINEKKFTVFDGLYGFAENFHLKDEKGEFIEHQTLLIIDECQIYFNSRSWNRSDRLSWIDFFRQHRKKGYDCILVSQDDKCIDKQIRSVLQTQFLHRNVANYKWFGKLLSWLCGGHLFICIASLYGMSSKKESRLYSFYFTGKKYFNFYNSMKTFG